MVSNPYCPSWVDYLFVSLAVICRWRSWERQLRFVAVWGAFVALALFYIIPITAVQGLINVRPCYTIRTHVVPSKLYMLFNQQRMALHRIKQDGRLLLPVKNIIIHTMCLSLSEDCDEHRDEHRAAGLHGLRGMHHCCALHSVQM